jgi:hypothetical protein
MDQFAPFTCSAGCALLTRSRGRNLKGLREKIAALPGSREFLLKAEYFQHPYMRTIRRIIGIDIIIIVFC